VRRTIRDRDEGIGLFVPRQAIPLKRHQPVQEGVWISAVQTYELKDVSPRLPNYCAVMSRDKLQGCEPKAYVKATEPLRVVGE